MVIFDIPELGGSAPGLWLDAMLHSPTRDIRDYAGSNLTEALGPSCPEAGDGESLGLRDFGNGCHGQPNTAGEGYDHGA